MNRRLGIVATLCVLTGIACFGGGTARATVLTYNETSYAGGDFPSTGDPSLGTLDIGDNTITGKVIQTSLAARGAMGRISVWPCV